MALSKIKTIYYKKVKFIKALGDKNLTFEALLKKALSRAKTVGSRVESPTADAVERRLINYNLLQESRETRKTIYGCEFLSFDEGQEQGAITTKNLKADELPVSAIKAGTDQEFMAGTIYFGARGNHVVICRSRALSTKNLEDYLNWLLKEQNVLDKSNAVTLNDYVSRKKKKAIKGVKGIELSSPIKFKPTDPAESEESKVIAIENGGDLVHAETQQVSFALAAYGKAWEAFKTFISDGVDLPHEINLQNLARTPNLQLKIQLEWKGRRHEDDSDFLDGVASTLRHIDDEIDYTINSKSGKIKRDDIKLFTKKNIKWTKMGRPDFSDFFPKMIDWLEELVNDGKIEP